MTVCVCGFCWQKKNLQKGDCKMLLKLTSELCRTSTPPKSVNWNARKTLTAPFLHTKWAQKIAISNIWLEQQTSTERKPLVQNTAQVKNLICVQILPTSYRVFRLVFFCWVFHCIFNLSFAVLVCREYILIFSVNTCYRMDLASPTKSWSSFPSMPLEAAYIGLAFVPAINRLYAIGGELGTSGFSRKVMKYDFSTNTWTTSG